MAEKQSNNGHGAEEVKENGKAPRRSNRQRAAEREYRPEYQQAGRRPAGEREHAFNALAWLVEGASGLLEELRHNDLGLSEEFWVHANAAQREGLLALRAAIDSLIAKSEQAQKQQEEQQARRERRGGISIQ